MPEKETIERAREKKQEGKAPSTQAGEFVREEMKHIKEGKHGARSPQQAVAIGLQKARRAGVDLSPPEKGRVKAKTQRSAESAYRRGQEEGELKRPAAKKSAAGKKSAAKRPAAKKSVAGKKSAAKRPAAKKSAAGKKSAAKRPAAKKSVAGKKSAAKRPAAKKSAAGKKSAAKRPAAQAAAAKKPSRHKAR